MTCTSYNFVIDSFAWIEYFRGTKKGEIVKDCLEKGSAATPSIVLAELSNVYERENNNFWERDLAFIISKTTIVNLDQEIASNAGKIKNQEKKSEHGFGLADAIILATAKAFSAKVVTGDKHFEKIKETLFLH